MDDSDETYAEGALRQGLDDYVMPFHIEGAGARGRFVRLGPAIDAILGRHDYPEPVSALLGEAVALTALLGAALKFEGKLILQTNSDGPVGFLVVHYDEPGALRGYASFDADAVAALRNGAPLDAAQLLGDGYLAMTIDPGAGKERYQGVVAMEGASLTEAAHVYFQQSEQIPTFIKIAVARQYTGGGKPGNGASRRAGGWGWRAGGILVQKLPGEGVAPEEDDEDWRRAEMLAATVEDHELIDPTLSPGRLLYQLFHEESVRAFKAKPMEALCQCSEERIAELLRSFSAEEIEEMVEPDGAITVTCEFCNRTYRFMAADFLGGEER